MSDEQAEQTDVPEPPPGYAVVNNPAGRLRYWLEIGQQRRLQVDQVVAQSSAQNQPPAMPVNLYETWCDIWGIDPVQPQTRLEYIRRGVGLIDAAAEARALAEALPEEIYMVEHALEHFNQIEDALTFFTSINDTSFPTMFTNIRETGWKSLKMMDDLLARESPGPSLTVEESADLRKMAQDLIDALMADTVLDAQLRMDLIQKVRDVDEALIKAAVLGTTVIVDSANTLLGHWYRLATRAAEIWNHPLTQAAAHFLTAVYTATEHHGAPNELSPGPYTEILGLPPGPSA